MSFPTRSISLIVLVFAASVPLFAAQHHRYRLVDIGTLGGPHSYGEINAASLRLLNDADVVSSFADTTELDPTCNVPDCYLAHAFRWKNGEITDLGSLAPHSFSAGGSINARGWMAGQGTSSTVDPNLGVREGRAILWTNDKLIDLGDLPGGHESLSVYVDDNGQVVGFSDNGVPDVNSSFIFPTGTQIRTFLWQNGNMQDIGTLGGASAVPGINCAGQPRNFIVGASLIDDNVNSSTGVPTLEPFLWKDGRMTDLGNLGGTIGTGTCSNSQEEIIGQSNLSGDAENHAFLWHKGVIQDLGTLGGPLSEAWWINDSGMIVGSADLPQPGLHDAVIWKDGKIKDLGTVDGDACSRAYGLNTHGQVVGGSTDCKSFQHATLWEDDGPMIDLNSLIAPGSGWQLTVAFNINEHGVILSQAWPAGSTPNGESDHLVLLFPCEDGNQACAGTADPAPAFQPNAPSHSTAPIHAEVYPSLSPVRRNVATWRERFNRGFNTPTRTP
jgi:probable HAF family extracellular repeat protein